MQANHNTSTNHNTSNVNISKILRTYETTPIGWITYKESVNSYTHGPHKPYNPFPQICPIAGTILTQVIHVL